MTTQCVDNGSDRDKGKRWEKYFCVIAARYGYCFTRHQANRMGAAIAWYRANGENKTITLPDVTLWTHPQQHHEIKHKQPDKQGRFGLEHYRLQSFIRFAEVTSEPVYYTIHDHSRCGGTNTTLNREGDWITADMRALAGAVDATEPGWSYVDGERTQVDICYWVSDKWIQLIDLWKALPE